MSTDPQPNSIWRHNKTKGLYIVNGYCTIEATMERGIIYTSCSDERTWVRPVSEFKDGRFTLTSDDN